MSCQEGDLTKKRRLLDNDNHDDDGDDDDDNITNNLPEMMEHAFQKMESLINKGIFI